MDIALLQGRRAAEAASCWTTRCASPAACRPTTPCCGARAAWASPRWSRRCTRWRTRELPGSLALIEIHREDIRSLPDLLNLLRGQTRRCLILCDDLSFEREDSDYKALKSVLDGGIEGRPDNVLFYATSNRRHLMPRDMIENERSTAINPSEATEEKVSLSDRFGLWLGFHNCDQDTFFAMVEGYAGSDAPADRAEALRAEAVEWSVTRGARSGRVAWQFIQDLAGRLGVKGG